MDQAVWQRLEAEFTEFPEAMAQPVPLEEIRRAEKELGVTFDVDYVKFVERYGGAQVGPQDVFGLRRAPLMGTSWPTVLLATETFKDWPGIKGKHVVSMDGSGNPIGIDQRGVVWVSDHNAGHKLEQVADSFAAFLMQLMD